MSTRSSRYGDSNSVAYYVMYSIVDFLLYVQLNDGDGRPALLCGGPSLPPEPRVTSNTAVTATDVAESVSCAASSASRRFNYVIVICLG